MRKDLFLWRESKKDRICKSGRKLNYQVKNTKLQDIPQVAHNKNHRAVTILLQRDIKIYRDS
jgi:hypothetical protein